MSPHGLRVALAAAFVVLLRADVAHAHAPGLVSPDAPFVVDEPTISQALYGVIRDPGDVFTVQLRPTTRLALPFEILVPHRDEWREHRPAFAIVARGMPALAGADAARLPRPLPEGAGAFVEWNDRPDREVTFESFLRRVYWSSGPVAVIVPAGDVEIWIWSPNGTTGKFVLGFGVEEGGLDYGDIIDHWSDYAY